jgi:hypothetical protein
LKLRPRAPKPQDVKRLAPEIRCPAYPKTLNLLLQNLGTDWDERVLPSIGNEIVKAVVAQYNAEQLLTQRDKVSRSVRLFIGYTLYPISLPLIRSPSHRPGSGASPSAAPLPRWCGAGTLAQPRLTPSSVQAETADSCAH